MVDRALGEDKLSRDLRVGENLGQQLEQLLLARFRNRDVELLKDLSARSRSGARR